MKLQKSISTDDLCTFTISQLNQFFPDNSIILLDDIRKQAEESLRRLEHCFSYVNDKYYFDGSTSVFNHLHGDQYATWLYLLSNEIYVSNGNINVCEKLFLLNKMLHGCDIFYEVNLPSVFLLVHPLGTVLGRADYSDFFVVYQRCGIGSNHDIYPRLGKYLTMRPGSAILGDAEIQENCHMAAESFLIDKSLPANTLVYGPPGNQKMKRNPSYHDAWRAQ